MKRKYLIVGSIAFFNYFARAQPTDSTSQIVKKTEIELVYNHYIQNGNNSAVTGGQGTEALTVYGPAINLKRNFKKNTYSLNMGADVITSASTDNIDYVVSSASLVDTRSYLTAGIERPVNHKNFSLHGGVGFSIESDYLSIGSKIGLFRESLDKMSTISLDFQMYNDDLRWGRLNPDEWRPVKLIYPSDLQNTEWFNNYRRNSYNLKLGWTQILNQRNILGFFPDFTVQTGLLSTPFHRIIFTDNSMAVEKLPGVRSKAALTMKLNTFVAGNIILKNSLEGYTDSFGIHAYALENETAVKISPVFTIMPSLRFYSQSASLYFAPYGKHDSNEKYFTSDYDLSKIQTYQAGIAFKYYPYHFIRKNLLFKGITFRYSYYLRSNNLYAHFFSLALQSDWVDKSY